MECPVFAQSIPLVSVVSRLSDKIMLFIPKERDNKETQHNSQSNQNPSIENRERKEKTWGLKFSEI